jgi:predicted nuclease of predicted toxin-antitoxin system
MTLQLVVDMNLSPDWIAELGQHGFAAVHWSAIGNPRADDVQILAWALAKKYVVFTHDLDFGTLLALTHAAGPSVLQIRTENVLPEHMGPMVAAALAQYEDSLDSGALVVVDERRSRVRILPIN